MARRGSKGSSNLLSSEAYDDDASTLRNSSEEDDRRPEQNSLNSRRRGHSEDHIFGDFDDDEDMAGQNNEANMNDRDILDSEDEREKLLSVAKDDSSIFGSIGRKKGKRVLVGSMRDEYKMEEGAGTGKSRSIRNMKVYDVDRQTVSFTSLNLQSLEKIFGVR